MSDSVSLVIRACSAGTLSACQPFLKCLCAFRWQKRCLAQLQFTKELYLSLKCSQPIENWWRWVGITIRAISRYWKVGSWEERAGEGVVPSSSPSTYPWCWTPPISGEEGSSRLDRCGNHFFEVVSNFREALSYYEMFLGRSMSPDELNFNSGELPANHLTIPRPPKIEAQK